MSRLGTKLLLLYLFPWVQSRGAAKHPTVYRAHPPAKNYLAPKAIKLRLSMYLFGYVIYLNI